MNAQMPVVHLPPPPPKGQAELRARVFLTEMLMRRMPDPGKFHVEHYYAHGVYGRALYIPKDVFLTGHIHKYPQINVLVCGDISVMTEEGIKRVRPPFIVVSPEGTKRIAFAHENTIWLTLLGTTDTDPEKIVDDFTVGTEEEYQEFLKSQEQEGAQLCPLLP